MLTNFVVDPAYRRYRDICDKFPLHIESCLTSGAYIFVVIFILFQGISKTVIRRQTALKSSQISSTRRYHGSLYMMLAMKSVPMFCS